MTSLVSRPAPGFTAPAILADNSLQDDFSLETSAGRYRVLFFYPLDFSHVCPTELLALDHRLSDFQERGCDVIGISVDSHHTHLAWKKTPVDDGGIGPVRFPLVSDLTKEISQAYGVLMEDGASLRATVILDPGGLVRHMTVNGPDVGRNVAEILRTLDAIRHVDQTGELCPANWGSEAGAKEEEKTGSFSGPAGIRKSVQRFDLSS
jgi:peroxiredoxin (alkyl hydroperoxide reductase subunit C)